MAKSTKIILQEGKRAKRLLKMQPEHVAGSESPQQGELVTLSLTWLDLTDVIHP